MSTHTHPHLVTFTDHLMDAIGAILGWSIVIGLLVGIPVGLVHLARWF